MASLEGCVTPSSEVVPQAVGVILGVIPRVPIQARPIPTPQSVEVATAAVVQVRVPISIRETELTICITQASLPVQVQLPVLQVAIRCARDRAKHHSNVPLVHAD